MSKVRHKRAATAGGKKRSCRFGTTTHPATSTSSVRGWTAPSHSKKIRPGKSFSPDGRRLMTMGSGDKVARIIEWALPAGE